MDNALRKKVDDLVESEVLWDCALAPYTSFQIGGPADGLVTVKSSSELTSLLTLFHQSGTSWFVIGRGTNLLVADEGYAGMVLVLDGDLAAIEKIDSGQKEVALRAGGGCGLGALVNHSARAGFGGLEFLAGIPGSVGGAVMMNAGAFGSEIGDVLQEVTVVTESGTVLVLQREQLQFSYRCWQDAKESGQRWVVSSVLLAGRKVEERQVRARVSELNTLRRQKQPRQPKNCGSFFKNPPGDSAGRLIDSVGLKGTRIGDAEVSEVHANFIINRGQATASDIIGLMKLIQQRVKGECGISLEPEVQMVGSGCR
ncbi:MAG: UDP-N-acetylmuramate dehydrogenase [Thermodesulfobacteriota bacterium]